MELRDQVGRTAVPQRAAVIVTFIEVVGLHVRTVLAIELHVARHQGPVVIQEVHEAALQEVPGTVAHQEAAAAVHIREEAVLEVLEALVIVGLPGQAEAQEAMGAVQVVAVLLGEEVLAEGLEAEVEADNLQSKNLEN